MSAYFTTHHFAPHWTTPRPPVLGEATTPQQQPHPVHPPPITTTITAPSISPPESTGANATSPSSSHRHLTLDTLARLLHDFHLANNPGTGDRDPVTHRSVARPHFDLVENSTSFAIYGELAGLGRQDVGVEVRDHLYTVTISGHLKRLVPLMVANRRTAEEEGGENVGVVHPDAGDAGSSGGEEAASGTTAKKGDEGGRTATERVHGGDQEVRWHVTERKVGGFRRAFQFPIESVDMGAVSASMSNGLLCVIVPKRIREKKSGGEARTVEVS